MGVSGIADAEKSLISGAPEIHQNFSVFLEPPYSLCSGRRYMEKHQQAKMRAERYIRIADHMLTQTYPLIKDPKLLLAVIENIFMSLKYSMETLLYFDRLYKRIPPFQENFESKFNMFRQRLISRYKIDQEYVNLIQDVRELIIEHRKSPVEFTRKDKFVICSDNYRMKTISIEQMKKFIASAKTFYHYVSEKVPR